MGRAPRLNSALRIYVRTMAFLALPLVFILVEIETRFIPIIEEQHKIYFALSLTVLLFLFPYFMVFQKKCPNCERAYFGANPFKSDFGADRECSYCRYYEAN